MIITAARKRAEDAIGRPLTDDEQCEALHLYLKCRKEEANLRGINRPVLQYLKELLRDSLQQDEH